MYALLKQWLLNILKTFQGTDCIASIVDLTLRDQILEMEEKIFFGTLGSLKIRDRTAWQKAIQVTLFFACEHWFFCPDFRRGKCFFVACIKFSLAPIKVAFEAPEDSLGCSATPRKQYLVVLETVISRQSQVNYLVKRNEGSNDWLMCCSGCSSTYCSAPCSGRFK